MPRKKATLNNRCTKEARRKHVERHQTTEPTAVRNYYLKVCRVCLATRVKTYNITEHGLGNMYKQVTGIEINNEDNLPRVLCWECVARLSNASNFIEKAQRSRWILTNNQINNGESLTINSIISMNKTEYGLNSTLGYKYFNANYANAHVIHDTVEADVDDTGRLSNNTGIDEAQVKVSKSEPHFDVGGNRETGKEVSTGSHHTYIVTYKEDNANNDDGIKSEPLDINIDLENEQSEVNVKEECLSDEEMVDESNNDVSQESIKKEPQFNESGHGNTNNSNAIDGGNTSMEVNNKKQYVCDICNKTFVCKNKIIYHLENHPEIFSCSLCAFKTYKKDHLAIHTNAEHTRTKEFHCPFCAYTAYDKNTLQEHMNVQHTKKSLYSCTFCAFKGYNKNILNKHIIANHSRTSSFNCIFCDFKTFHKVHLLEHTNIKHTKSVCFTCSFCNFKTCDKNTLSSHINAKHIKNTIYKCSGCNYVAYEKYHLNRHVKMKHT